MRRLFTLFASMALFLSLGLGTSVSAHNAAYHTGWAYTCEGGLHQTITNTAKATMVIDGAMQTLANGDRNPWAVSGPRVSKYIDYDFHIEGQIIVEEGTPVTLPAEYEPLPPGWYKIEIDVHWDRAGSLVNYRTVTIDAFVPACT